MSRTNTKHSVVIGGHKTSICLEEKFWLELKRIAGLQQVTISQLVGKIQDDANLGANLSSSLRVYILEWSTRADFRRSELRQGAAS